TVSEQIRGLATGLALSNSRGARGEIDRILTGASTDLREIQSLPVGDRIAKLLLEFLRDRLSQIKGADADEELRRARLRLGLGFKSETDAEELVWPGNAESQRNA